MTKPGQKALLLNWLETHDGISTLEAMENLRILRLSQLIIELQRLGISIDHVPETTPNGHHIVRYRLLKVAYG